MTVEETIALLQKENPKAELYVLRLQRMGNPAYNSWSYVHKEWRRITGVQRQDGLVGIVQESEAALANAAR